MSQTTGPSKDGSNGVGRGRVALMILCGKFHENAILMYFSQSDVTIPFGAPGSGE